MKKTIILGLLLAIALTGCIKKTGSKTVVISAEEAKVKVAEFINKNLMQSGSEVSIKEVTEEGDLYKVIVNMSNGQEITSYVTKDGKKFFPQVMDIEEVEQKTAEAADPTKTPPPAVNAPKADKAKVELFVMSHCPYGTQIEKGILPVLETLGDKVDFELKFCDYAMHGKKELDEQLNQYCIQENEPEKLVDYLTCFLEADEGEKCLKEAGINTYKLNTCVANTDNEFKVTELFNDKTTWKSGRFPQFNVNKDATDRYGIAGSPGLVVNGEKVSAGRDSAGLLSAICSGYNNPPEECQTELSSTAPSPGFGFSGTGSNSDAGCGS